MSRPLPLFQSRLPESEYVPPYAYNGHARHKELVKEFIQMAGSANATSGKSEVTVSELIQNHNTKISAHVDRHFQQTLEKAFDLVYNFVSDLAETHKNDFRDVARASACVGEIRKILDVHGKTLRETFPQYVAADNQVERENCENISATTDQRDKSLDAKGGVVSIPRDVAAQSDGRVFTLPPEVLKRLRDAKSQQAGRTTLATDTSAEKYADFEADAKRLRLDSLPSASDAVPANKTSEKLRCNCALLDGVTSEKVYSLVGGLTRPGTVESISMEGFGTEEAADYAARNSDKSSGKNDLLLSGSLNGPPSHLISTKIGPEEREVNLGIRAFLPPRKDYLRLFHGINYCDALAADKREMVNNPINNWIDSEIVSGDIYAGSSRMLREYFVNLFRSIMLLFDRFESDMNADLANYSRVAEGLSVEQLHNARAFFCLCFPISEYFVNDYVSLYHGWTLLRQEESKDQ